MKGMDQTVAEGQLFIYKDAINSRHFYQDGGRMGATEQRLESAWSDFPSPLFRLSASYCVYCETSLLHRWESVGIHKVQNSFLCKRCGFSWIYSDESVYGGGWEDSHVAYLDGATREGDVFEVIAGTLLRINVNDSRLGLAEVGSHPRRRFSDRFHLDWHLFEILIADVYRHLGFEPRLTARSRDGGYDIMLVERSSGERAIVEVKKYARHRRVGISVVDRVLGVQLRTGIPRAKIVTTSSFTGPAKQAATQAIAQVSALDLELVGATELLKALEVYNESLPPLWEVL